MRLGMGKNLQKEMTMFSPPDGQYRLDCHFFDVSFTPVISKNRSDSDHYFSGVILYRAGLTAYDSQKAASQKILNDYFEVLNPFEEDFS